MQPVSFIVPCFNSESTILGVVDSIIKGNLHEYDEIVMSDDGSSDLTLDLINSLKNKYNFISIFHNTNNLGGAANRNKCIENSRNNLIFCLDSDNYLYPGSVSYLRSLQSIYAANAVAFSSINFCKTQLQPSSHFNQREVESSISHTWQFKTGAQTLDDYLVTGMVAGSSGNYLFTKESWDIVGGYPLYSDALDTWAFGLKQSLLPGLFLIADFGSYLHTYGHNSYWTRLGDKRLEIMKRIIAEAAAASYVHPEEASRLLNASADTILESYSKDPVYLEYKKLRAPSSTLFSYTQYIRQKALRVVKSI